MTTGLDNLINEVAWLRLEVERLRARVATLQSQVSEREGEATALRIMLAEWPVQCPIPPSVVH